MAGTDASAVLDVSTGLTGRERVPIKSKSHLIPNSNQIQPPPMTTGDEMIADWQGIWFVAHTKSRFEKALAWDLHQRGVNYFLPMEAVISTKGGKKREIHRVIFPSYLFFCGTDDDRYTALATNRICQILVAHNQERLRQDLTNWHAGLVVDHPSLTSPSMREGTRVRVSDRTHMFYGMYGTFVKTATGGQIELDVEMLGRVCACAIDPYLVETV